MGMTWSTALRQFGQAIVYTMRFQLVLVLVAWALFGAGRVFTMPTDWSVAIGIVALVVAAAALVAQLLAVYDPGNAEWQLPTSHIKIGDVLVQQGNLAEALASYQAGLAIAERLAEADPGNMPKWQQKWQQRNLSVSHIKIGDVLVQQGNLAEALASYQAGLAIAERLAEADPGNAVWQRDLSIAQERVERQLDETARQRAS